ncbi:hypothetical protein PR048_033563 [Dryococelus australis]|uniref:Uncharacterized protein n=1 Tax=Dryococelus australis TaxID=614101 RepID=A0ABQ9G4R8_9NEOP|nr:hypothetical protein PR048_033563 [Dryococelus australis]
MYSLRNGGVMAEAADEQTLRKIQTASKIRSLGLKLEKPCHRGPKIMVYDMPRELDNERELMETFHQQNFGDSGVSLDTLKRDMGLAVVTSEMVKLAEETMLDVVLFQEPYVLHN